MDRGVPAICICTEPFLSAAQTHARILNWAGQDPVTIPHPLQTLLPDAVAARADSIVDQIVNRLRTPRQE